MNEVLSITRSSLLYIMNVPFFWGSMGFTVAISMLISPLLFDGDMKLALKALAAKLLYIAMLLWVTISQIIDVRFNNPQILTPSIKMLSYVTALNIVVVSIAWLTGLLLGVLVIRIKYWNKLHKF